MYPSCVAQVGFCNDFFVCFVCNDQNNSYWVIFILLITFFDTKTSIKKINGSDVSLVLFAVWEGDRNGWTDILFPVTTARYDTTNMPWKFIRKQNG